MNFSNKSFNYKPHKKHHYYRIKNNFNLLIYIHFNIEYNLLDILYNYHQIYSIQCNQIFILISNFIIYKDFNQYLKNNPYHIKNIKFLLNTIYNSKLDLQFQNYFQIKYIYYFINNNLFNKAYIFLINQIIHNYQLNFQYNLIKKFLLYLKFYFHIFQIILNILYDNFRYILHNNFYLYIHINHCKYINYLIMNNYHCKLNNFDFLCNKNNFLSYLKQVGKYYFINNNLFSIIHIFTNLY